MIEKLNKFDLNTSEIEKLTAYQSRDGFVLLYDAEFDEIENYFSHFPIYKNLVALLTDENSNYWCINVSGPMKGMICYLSHDEPNLEPKFKNISSFLKVIDENPAEFNERKQIIEELKTNFHSENDEDVRLQIAYSIIALTSVEEIENSIYPFLDDEDMYIQERAIQILGFHKYKPAKEKLIEMKTSAMPNGQTAIGIALKKLNVN